MIYEIRTYQIAPGSLAEVEKRFGEGYEARKKYSPLTAFWHTEIGPLNEIIHVWPYKDLGERATKEALANAGSLVDVGGSSVAVEYATWSQPGMRWYAAANVGSVSCYAYGATLAAAVP